MKRISAFVIRGFGLGAILIGAFIGFDYVRGEWLPQLISTAHESSYLFPRHDDDFRVSGVVGVALIIVGITCRLVARRILRQRVTAHDNAA